MITADQLICHAIGDYLLQSDWMASEKTKRSFAAWCHVFTYVLPFVFLCPSLSGLAVIVITHFVIDRWRLARYVVYVKNVLAPRAYWYPWAKCQITGYTDDRPLWMTVWLMIIADNVAHILINALALKYL